MTFDYARAREAMGEQQVRPWDVLDPRVLEALSTLSRDAFVAPRHRALAYADLALPIGHGESMMKPVLEGRTLQALLPQAGEAVLEIGTGSGFLTACLGRLAREVHSIERHGDLAEAARERLATAGIANASVEHADAFAWDTGRRFDVVCVTGAVDALPSRFVGWLRPGGRLFVVEGRAPAMQALLFTAEVNGLRRESLFETELGYLHGAAPVAEFQFQAVP